MKTKKLLRLLLMMVLLCPFVIRAQHNSTSKNVTSKEENSPKETRKFILHHLNDAHSFTVWHEMGWTFPLPVILWDNGLQIFSSSKFDDKNGVAASNGNYYKIVHSKIYKTDAEGTIDFEENGHPANVKPFDISITKNVASIFIAGFMLFFVFLRMAKTYQKSLIPGKGGKFFEPLILFVRDEIAIPNIGEKHYKKYMSYLLTIFFFIWFVNLVGLTPFGINITGNITITFALAILTFVITQFSGKKNYWAHIFWMPNVPVPMKIILAPIEVLGIFIKPFALMIRLFANMSAGHIVLMSLVALLYVFTNWFAKGAFLGLALFLSIIELLVAFLQAYIFTILTALYFGSAVAEHDEH